MGGGKSAGAKRRRDRLRYVGLISPAILLAFASHPARAGQLTASAFQAYNAANAGSIQAGPFALYSVSVGGIQPTQVNEGFTEVGKKTAGFDLLSPAGLQANLLTAIEPVVIGPGGTLYLTDGHHTFTALDKSIYGASNPTVYVNVIANYSNLTTAQFYQKLQSLNFLLPLNNGVPEIVNTATGAPIPTSLTGLNNDPYRGLEYSILKNKSAVLFPTAANITGAVGSSTPGLDKMTGFYSDFLEAAAYRSANNGLGLPYLSPGDIALATQWNLNPTSQTKLPNVAGTVTAAQLPGFILANSITLNGVISNTTLANGALDGNGTFTGITMINAGSTTYPILIGTPNTGFVLQVGSDKGNSVTLGGANTYTGGTSILAGNLVVASDAALGAAVPTGASIDPNNVRSSVQAANGIVFNSLSEGNGTLTLGTTAGAGTATFTSVRPVAVSGEVATINLNGYQASLGALYSFGSGGVGLGNATGESDLTIDDNSANKGVLTLSAASPYFYGNIIIGSTNAPTVRVMSDAALGNTTGVAASIGQVDLNGGTLQAGASFAAPERNLFLGGGSNFDVNGFTTSWGNLTDVQRTLDILNSNTTTAGAVTFNSLAIGGTATVQLAGGAAGETVTLTNGLTRQPGATLVLMPTSATSLGTATEKVFSGVGTSSLVNTIAPAYIVTNNGAKGSAGPYDFVTYGPNGYVKATYSQTTLTNTPTSVVALGANTTAGGNVAAFALNTEGRTIGLGTNTLTIGDGANPGGVILASGSQINGGTLAFGGSEGVLWLSGTNPTISAKITGSNGLTFAGSGAVALSTAAAVNGAITIDSGTVTLAGTNIFASDTTGVTLADTKSKPAPATLAVTANNTLASLNSVGNNSAVTLGNGAALTIGTTGNLSSTLSSAITETGAATAGALTFGGTGLADLSGISKGKLSLLAGSTIVVNDGAQLRLAASSLGSSTFGFTLNGASDLQFAQNGGGVLANQVTGTGSLHLIGGTLQITGTANTYSGGTIVETGSILDVTTANLPAANPNITNAGGLVVFDQATTGTYAGVISDGKELGTGPMMSGSFDKDDSTGANAGNVTLTKAQTYTGATTVEAGTLTLGAVDTIATSSGVDLGRVGGGATATLALAANNTIQALTSETGNTTAVTLGANTLTIAATAATAPSFGGVISGPGALVKTGAGTQILTGASTYSGATAVNGGTLEVDGSIASNNVIVNNGGTLSGTGTIGDPTIAAGGTLAPGNAANPTGTLTIVGPLGFAAGSFYNVNITPTANSLTKVVGATTIAGGTVRVMAGAGKYAVNQRYTILTSTAGVTGRFATAVASNLAFLAPKLSYDAGDVYLTLVQGNAFRSVAANQNQASVASALDRAARGVEPGTSADRIVSALDRLTATQARAAFTGLSGEGITAAQNVAHRSAELFTSSIFDQTTFYGANSANSITLTAPPIRELADLPTNAAGQPVPFVPLRTWRAWATGFGGVENVHGNAAIGSANQDNTIYGGVLGVDYQVSPNLLVGVALGGSDGEFQVAQRGTSGSTTGGHVALYDLATFGSYYGAASVSFSEFTNRTTRSVGGFGGVGGETERGNFDSDEVRSRLEVGKHFAGLGGELTPFVAVEGADLRSNGFTESALSGPGLFRLGVSGQSAASVPAFIGARLQRVTDIGGGIVLTPTLQAAYVHEFAPYRSQVGSLVDLPGATFLVDGARPSRDAAQVKVGAELAIGPRSTLFFNFDGEFSGVDQLYAGKGGLRVVW